VYFLQRQHREPLQKHVWCGWNKQALTRASALISEPHCTADVCRVNDQSINGRERPLYSRATTYEVFLGGYSTSKYDYMTCYICHVTCKCRKNVSIAVLLNIPFSNCLKVTRRRISSVAVGHASP